MPNISGMKSSPRRSGMAMRPMRIATMRFALGSPTRTEKDISREVTMVTPSTNLSSAIMPKSLISGSGKIKGWKGGELSHPFIFFYITKSFALKSRFFCMSSKFETYTIYMRYIEGGIYIWKRKPYTL